jgi:hypothetical protein
VEDQDKFYSTRQECIHLRFHFPIFYDFGTTISVQGSASRHRLAAADRDKEGGHSGELEREFCIFISVLRSVSFVFVYESNVQIYIFLLSRSVDG